MGYQQNKDINIEKYIIYGEQRHGKTMLAINLACHWHNIFGNVEIRKNGKIITKKINKTRDINYIPFQSKGGVIIFDETGINFNSKKSGSENNIMLSEFFFLAGKKNLSSIFISQRFMSIPIDIRELTNYIFKCRKYYDLDGIHFIAIKQKQKGKELEDIQEFEIKNLDLMDYNGIEYNTLQESKIKKEDGKNKKKKKIKKKIIKKIDKKKKSI